MVIIMWDYTWQESELVLKIESDTDTKTKENHVYDRLSCTL